MPGLTRRLDAVSAALHTARQRQSGDGHKRLLERMYAGPVDAEDFYELIPGFIDTVEQDIVRNALQIRDEIAAGRTPQIRGDRSLLGAIVALPPERTVPKFLVDQVRDAQASLFPPPWERLEPTVWSGWWVKRCLYYLAIGTPTGDALRARLDQGAYDHLCANGQLEGDDFEDDYIYEGSDEIAAAIIEAISDHAPQQGLPPPGSIYDDVLIM